MPESMKQIDYAMEAASGPHFSGLRFDGLFASASSSPRASDPPSSSSPLADSSAPKQPFVIGNNVPVSVPFHLCSLTRFNLFLIRLPFKFLSFLISLALTLLFLAVIEQGCQEVQPRGRPRCVI